MSNLVLELFSEEIPARMQAPILQQALKLLEKKIIDIADTEAVYKGFVTPRRLVFAIENLPKEVITKALDIRGPKITAPQQAIEGFLKKCQLTSVDSLVKKEIKQEQYYFYEISATKNKFALELPKILEEFIKELSKMWPKTMRWGAYKVKWVRPLHNILCLFDNQVINLEYAHLKANNITYGHRFLAQNRVLNIVNYYQYFAELEKNYIILEQDKRKKKIISALHKEAEELDLKLVEDQNLLNEVTGLVEYPVILLGKISKEFLSLPKEVLITTLKNHQKCFCLQDEVGDIAPYFLFVSNNNTSNNKKLILGNEKVVTARLNDAKYFYETDLKISLTEHQVALEKIIFHKKVGTMIEHTNNNAIIAKFISVWVKNSHLVEAEVAANLAKADLTTEIVGELPELQGIAGYYYALHEGLDMTIANAIKEHYLPQTGTDYLPTHPLSIAVAIADKLNSLVALTLVNEVPTGSKDPYGLRRFAVGIIRITLYNKLNIPLRLIIEKSINNYFALTKKHKEFYPDYKEGNFKDFISTKILNFIIERYKIILRDNNISYDVINALFDNNDEDNLLIIYNKAKSLDSMTKTHDGQEFLASYRRVYKIHHKAQKEDGILYDKKPHYLALKSEAEKNLYKVSKNLKSELNNLLKNGEYENAFIQVKKITIPINEFFDQVVVNDNNKNLRENRLKLLATICKTVNNLADFSKIEQ